MGEKYEASGHRYPPPYDQGPASAPRQDYGPPHGGGYASPPPVHQQPVFVPVAAPAPAAPAVNTVQVNLQNNMSGGGGRAIPGSCPVCGGTEWTGTYDCCAWFCCFFFFPIGVLFCLCMRKKKCCRCGFTLG